MTSQKRKLILILSISLFLPAQFFVVRVCAWAFDADTLSPLAVVSSSNFEEAFDHNMDAQSALDARIKGIKKAYGQITEMDAYPGFTKTLDADNAYRNIGIFLVSDIDEADKIINILPVDKDTKVCELGSGIGNVSALFAARGADVIGYEIDQKLVWLSNNIARIDLKEIVDPDRLRFERANFLNKDLSRFDIVFYYWNGMVSEFKDDLEQKLLKELKPGGFLVVYGTNKDKEYFPGLSEAAFLPGYESISANARIYYQTRKTASFSADLNSPDAEACLQAAIVLAKNGQLDTRVYAIIRDAAVNVKLTLNDRVRAAEFLNQADRLKYEQQLIHDKAHFERIERFDKKDFESLELADVSLEQVQKQIGMIPGIDKTTAAELTALAGEAEFKDEELYRLSNGISYFEGDWHELLLEKFFEEHGYDRKIINTMIADDTSDVRIFNTLDYVRAYLVSQKITSRMRNKGIVVMGGDREWLLLEAFKNIFRHNYSLAQAEAMLENKWKSSTAASRAKEIFEDLRDIGLIPGDIPVELKAELLADIAQQFIYRGYVDDSFLEYASGPNYDARGISVGVENNVGKINALHINLGVSWASKYIWASYLALDNFIDSQTMNKGYYDYFYDQQIKQSSQFFPGQRRVSYIGVWTDKLADIQPIVEVFVPLSMGLNSYMSEGNAELGAIWRNFREEFIRIIIAQNDPQLEKEFFKQTRMTRFVDLISSNNRNNDFYDQIKALIRQTIKQIDNKLSGHDNDSGQIQQFPEFLRFSETAVLNSI